MVRQGVSWEVHRHAWDSCGWEDIHCYMTLAYPPKKLIIHRIRLEWNGNGVLICLFWNLRKKVNCCENLGRNRLKKLVGETYKSMEKLEWEYGKIGDKMVLRE